MWDSGWMRGALAMLGVAGVLAVSACGDGTTPEPSSSASAASGSSSPASESSSESAEPMEATPDHPAQNLVPPELPEEATEFTEEGLAAFVEHWFEVHNYGLATGDGEPLKEISDDDCMNCNSALENTIGAVAEADGESWYVGGERQADDVVAMLSEDRQEEQTALVELRQFSGDVYTTDGLAENGSDVVEDSVDPVEFTAVYQSGAWIAIQFSKMK